MIIERQKHFRNKRCLSVAVLLLLCFCPIIFASFVSAQQQANLGDIERIIRQVVKEDGDLTRQVIIDQANNINAHIDEHLSALRSDMPTKIIMITCAFLFALLVFAFIQFKAYIKKRKLEQRLKREKEQVKKEK